MSKEYTFNEWINIHKNDFDDNSEILNESTPKTVESAENQLIRLYSHILKWCFWKHARCTSWINTIYDSIDSLCEGLVYNGIGDKRKPISKDIYLEAYSIGLKQAIQESNHPELYTENLLEIYQCLMNIKEIIKPENIDKILMDHTLPNDYRYRECLGWLEIGYNNCLDKVNKVKYKGKYKD